MFPLFAFDVKMRFICMRIKNEKYFSYYFTGFALNLALTQRYGQLGNGLYIFSGILLFIIHQTHYEKSDWSRAFNQFTIACELDMINAYLLQILHLSCQVQRLPGYQAPWSVLLRNRMAECLLLPIV